MKILIILPTRSEEVLLATPAIRALKTALDSELHVVTNKVNKGLLTTNPYVDQFYDFNDSLFPLRKSLKELKTDCVVDLNDSLRSKLLRLGIANKILSVGNSSFNEWLFVKTKINRLPKDHQADQYLELLAPLGIKEDSLGIDFFIPEKDEVERNWLPSTHQNSYAVVAINASHNTRKLPTHRLIELCDRINKPIILIGDKGDMVVAEEVESFFKRGSTESEKALEELNKKAVVFNACGKFNFNQCASIVKNASWVFTYDNLIMHVASALKKRIYSIWGNTTPLFQTYPYRTQFTVFENNKLNCRPCTKFGYANCPKGHFKCMNDLTFDFYLPD